MKSDYQITKEEHLFTCDEKLKWFGYGEWVEEIDWLEFIYLGYTAKIFRICEATFTYPRLGDPPLNLSVKEQYFGGHLCGYVKLPEYHMYYGKQYNDMHVDCHHGLTFGDLNSEHWIGFDCAHSTDYVPSMEYLRKKNGSLINDIYPIPEEFKNFSLFNPVYRNMEYCIDQCIHIIDQLIDMQMIETINKSSLAMEEYENENN